MKVTEIFASIQGEGKYVGRPQTFIRLSGCNLRCNWCDTDYAQKEGEEMSVEEIIEKVLEIGIKSVSLTGGEPMIQKEQLRILINGLKDLGFEIHLETNGTIYDKWIFDTVDCVSLDMKPPSSGEQSEEALIERITEKDQIKIIIASDADLEYAKTICELTDLEVILQPEKNADPAKLLDWVISSKKRVRLIPQVHKILGVQ